MASLTSLGNTAQTLLAAFARQLAAAGVEVPEDQFVAPGPITAWDGELLAVNLETIDRGQPGTPIAGTAIPPSMWVGMAQFAVTLVRAVPSLYADGPVGAVVPTAAQMNAESPIVFDDAGQMILAAIQIHQQSLVTGPGEGFEIGPCNALEPAGGLGGTRLLVTLSLT